ncbi:conserved Plasmodium protein, unknown function [Plasmodium ovale curtisi]|uniref:Uncharacterized protein n=1 Tax=Plasmodium ovale curtisi TaxID=864141 RepID=A0A1A8W6D5_PLAOA|nr:conserved Plasmodium protein, unknown function [Plasmodium ovale curtisi]
MDFQRIATFCFIISYIIFCHIIWNGCYNIYASSEDDVYNLLYYRKKVRKPVKLEIRNKIKLNDINRVYVKKTPCPVLPRPIKSIFHLNWFRKSSDLIPISIQLYSMFDEKNNFLGFILLSSAIFTIIEWIYIVVSTNDQGQKETKKYIKKKKRRREEKKRKREKERLQCEYRPSRCSFYNA